MESKRLSSTTIFDSSFIIKLGRNNLLDCLAYLRDLPSKEIGKILSAESEQISNETAIKVLSLLYGSNTSSQQKVIDAFEHIKHLASERGQEKLNEYLRVKDPNSSFLSDDITAFDAATGLFIKENELARKIYADLIVDTTQNWAHYSSNKAIEFEKDLALIIKRFQSEVKEAFKVDKCQVSIFDLLHDRNLIHIELPDRLTSSLDYSQDKPETLSFRPVLEIFILYYPKENSFNIHYQSKTKKRIDNPQNQIKEIFVRSCCKKPNEILPSIQGTKVNLDQLKSLPAINSRDPKLKIEKIGVYASELSATPDNDLKIKVSSNTKAKQNLQSLISPTGIEINSLNLSSVSLEFTFEGKGKSKKKRVTIKTNGNLNLRGTENKDQAIRQCLIDLGILEILKSK